MKQLIAAGLGTFSFLSLFAGAIPAASAAGLQVAPVTVKLVPNRQAASLWLVNASNEPMEVQARVFGWTQADGQDKLDASRDLVVSPPMARLAPGQRQMVRVVRTGPPPSGPQYLQQAYRIVVDELPGAKPRKDGLNFVMRYSVPVFIEPAGNETAQPSLRWSAQGAGRALHVRNDGRGAAQVAELAYVAPDGKRTVVMPGLMGYVLPGSQRRWELPKEAVRPPAPGASAGRWEAQINGQRQVLEVAGP